MRRNRLDEYVSRLIQRAPRRLRPQFTPQTDEVIPLRPDGMLAPHLTMSNDAPKSAYELAMERLRRKDAEAGVVSGSVSEAQKIAIAEVRRVAEARLAELQILHQSALAGAYDPAVRETMESEYRRNVQRVADDRERKIAAIREQP